MGSKVTRRGEVISLDTRRTISVRYHTITKAINGEFWVLPVIQCIVLCRIIWKGNSNNSSDIDMLVELPEASTIDMMYKKEMGSQDFTSSEGMQLFRHIS